MLIWRISADNESKEIFNLTIPGIFQDKRNCMGDSTENTNEINSYGVWVKRGPDENAEESPQVHFNDTDLPDLSENVQDDDGDMFITPPPEPQATSFGDETKDASDTMPNSDGIEGFDGADFSAFDIPKDIAAPTNSTADIPDGEVSFDDLLGGDSSDGEISLDAFMSGDSDEISLDDFLDDFGGGSSQKEDDVPDDMPLDINVKFNEDPKNQVPTEDIPLEDNSEDSEEIAEPEASDTDAAEIDEAADENKAEEPSEPVHISPVATETVDFALEEISLDDFNLDESDDATAAALGASINSAATADDGLAMFGKPKVVDYDLAITEDDVTQAAPNVEETESPKGQEQNTNTTTVDNSLLEQIVSDLAGLKNEITSIKADLANLKEGKIAIPSVKTEDNNSPEIDAPTSEIEPSTPEMAEIDSMPNIPEMPDAITEDGEATSPFFDEAPTEKPVETQEGFFSDNDDDIVALSGNELDNIVNTSEITEEENIEADSDEKEISLESENASELEANAEISEEPSSENQDIFFSDNDEEIALSGNELDNIVNTSEMTEEISAPEGEVLEDSSSEEIVAPNAQEALAEEVVETEVESFEEAENTSSVGKDEDDFSTKFSENSPFGTISDDDMALESTETPDTGLYMDIDNNALEEPNLEEIEQNVEDSEDISLPKSEEIPLEGEDKIIPPDESAIISDEPVIEDPTFEEPVAEDTISEEPAIDETAFEEPVVEDTICEEPAMDETVSEDTAIEEPIADKMPIEEPAFEEPATEDTISEEPAMDETASEDTAIEEPIPIAEEPPIEDPAFEEPIADEPPVEEPAFEEPVAEDTICEEPAMDETASEDTAIEEPIADEMPIEDPAFEEPATEDTICEEPAIDETVSEDTAIEEPIADEPAIEETVVQETQNPIDYEEAKQIQDGYINDITNEDDSISETLSNENMDYLSEDKDILSAEIDTTENSQTEASATDLPHNLKSEVKSVLLYMDQLLENLPEEKIVEFAKSDHFATYKKLFNELGLA